MILIASEATKFHQILGLRKIRQNIQPPSYEEALNDPFLKQEFKDLMSTVCTKWVDKMKLTKEVNFSKAKKRFFSKTSRTHLKTGMKLDETH